jgi:hypothetical protein
MRGNGFTKRLGTVRQRLKAYLYAALDARLRGKLDADQQAHAVTLFQHLCRLEREDGDGGLGRVLARLPRDLANQLREELWRRFNEEASQQPERREADGNVTC